MRIRAFSKNIEVNETLEFNLKNCSVVIDGQNYFYNLYKESGLPFQFGCESDKYADYLRDHLSMYKKANVKCYFVFKGGHADEEKRFKDKDKYLTGITYEKDGSEDDFVLPVFMKTVYKEVLDEMGFDYVICQFESKKQCIALAQMLKCPIISFDIEYVFSGVPYVPYKSYLEYESPTISVHCRIFNLENFTRKHRISKEKLALFIVLTDENLFPAHFFQPLFKRERIPYFKPFKRNQELIKWLSRNKAEHVFQKVFQILSPEDKLKFEDEYTKMLGLIDRAESPGEAVNYLISKGDVLNFDENDARWFEKGVIANHIGPSYVNLYYSGFFYGSWCIEDVQADDALFLSIDIIKYAFNLLTNYQKDSISFQNNKWEVQKVIVNVTNSKSDEKPPYEALHSPFENGWDDRLNSLKLFDFFLEEYLPDVSLVSILDLPKEARLLMITLVYFSSRKTVDVTREIYSILLSYIMLGAVFPILKNNKNNIESPKPGNNDCVYDLVTTDCNAASSILEPFFKLTRSELGEIFDRKLIHAFVEFQHCLNHMSNLNKLCGQCFQPTVYNKTYNGTFVYKIFSFLKNYTGNMALQKLTEMLSPAPTVLNYFLRLVTVYEQIMLSKSF